MADEKVFEVQNWTYIGKRWGNGKLYSAWQTPQDKDAHFQHKRGNNYVIGGVYEVEATADGTTARVSGAKFLIKPEHEDLPRWIAEDRAAQLEADRIAAEKRAKRDEADDVAQMTLKQARAFIDSGPWMQRASRLAIILRYLGA